MELLGCFGNLKKIIIIIKSWVEKFRITRTEDDLIQNFQGNVAQTSEKIL